MMVLNLITQVNEKTMEKEIGKVSSKDIDGYKKIIGFYFKNF